MLDDAIKGPPGRARLHDPPGHVHLGEVRCGGVVPGPTPSASVSCADPPLSFAPEAASPRPVSCPGPHLNSAPEAASRPSALRPWLRC